MITIIAEHSVDLDLLPEHANILDLGCRGFQFYKAMSNFGYNVFPVDIDELNGNYYQCAITNYDGFCGVQKNSDPQATKIGPGESIPCYTLDSFSKKMGIEFWDLIKIDIEGSEYEVIISLKTPPAKQLSIEFHLHCGQTKAQVEEMSNHLGLLGYKWISGYELTQEHGAGYNYWDTLFILQ